MVIIKAMLYINRETDMLENYLSVKISLHDVVYI